MVLDCVPRLVERQSTPARSLSGGEQQILASARALLCNGRLTVMVELTEGLSLAVVDEIGATGFKRSVLIRRFEGRASRTLNRRNFGRTPSRKARCREGHERHRDTGNARCVRPSPSFLAARNLLKTLEVAAKLQATMTDLVAVDRFHRGVFEGILKVSSDLAERVLQRLGTYAPNWGNWCAKILLAANSEASRPSVPR